VRKESACIERYRSAKSWFSEPMAREISYRVALIDTLMSAQQLGCRWSAWMVASRVAYRSMGLGLPARNQHRLGVLRLPLWLQRLLILGWLSLGERLRSAVFLHRLVSRQAPVWIMRQELLHQGITWRQHSARR
jgi:hypothetical protein